MPSKTTNTKRKPALIPEDHENRLISSAYALAEKQIIEGTASSQVITHFLKLGSTKEKLEHAILEEKKKLYAAKTEQMESAKQMKVLYSQAIEAMKRYSGHGEDEDE